MSSHKPFIDDTIHFCCRELPWLVRFKECVYAFNVPVVVGLTDAFKMFEQLARRIEITVVDVRPMRQEHFVPFRPKVHRDRPRAKAVENFLADVARIPDTILKTDAETVVGYFSNLRIPSARYLAAPAFQIVPAKEPFPLTARLFPIQPIEIKIIRRVFLEIAVDLSPETERCLRHVMPAVAAHRNDKLLVDKRNPCKWIYAITVGSAPVGTLIGTQFLYFFCNRKSHVNTVLNFLRNRFV